eukprot:PhM_4_TR2140/c3_g1_i10/m.13597
MMYNQHQQQQQQQQAFPPYAPQQQQVVFITPEQLQQLQFQQQQQPAAYAVVNVGGVQQLVPIRQQPQPMIFCAPQQQIQQHHGTMQQHNTNANKHHNHHHPQQVWQPRKNRESLMPRADKAKLVCRHWLAGRCTRPFCHFKHAVEEGDAIPDVPANNNNNNKNNKNNNAEHDEEDILVVATRPDLSSPTLLRDFLEVKDGHHTCWSKHSTGPSTSVGSIASVSSHHDEGEEQHGANSTDVSNDNSVEDDVELSDALRDVLKQCTASEYDM